MEGELFLILFPQAQRNFAGQLAGKKKAPNRIGSGLGVLVPRVLHYNEEVALKTRCTGEQIEFHALGRRSVTGRFDSGRISSDGCGVLLRKVDKRTEPYITRSILAVFPIRVYEHGEYLVKNAWMRCLGRPLVQISPIHEHVPVLVENLTQA